MDRFDAQKRSNIMSAVRSRNTGTELAVRSLTHKLGFRYSLHRKDLPGSPDLVFSSRRKIIFVHGCFWHQHSSCSRSKAPVTRRAYWLPKLEAMGIAIAPSPKELAGSLTPFASFCWGIPDNDLSRRGNAHIFCNLFPDYKSNRSSWKAKAESNVSPELISALGIEKDVEPESELCFYSYAVLCSNWYLNRFKSALFKVGSWPRIPIPMESTVFSKVVTLGKQLAMLEDFSIKMGVGNRYQSLVDNWSDIKMTGYELNPEDELIHLKDDAGDVHTISLVPRSVIEFSVGGYHVLREWLKFHSEVYLRSTFTKEHLQEMLSTCTRVHKHIDISLKVDEILSSFAEDPHALWSAEPKATRRRKILMYRKNKNHFRQGKQGSSA
jgi:DNA mismatch endonuclease Vsr